MQLPKSDALVSQVLVVDNGSIVGAPRVAREAGAEVITSTLLGEGASMEDGLWSAHNEIVAYIDGDLSKSDQDLIARISQPIREGRADRFNRLNMGHVKEVFVEAAREMPLAEGAAETVVVDDLREIPNLASTMMSDAHHNVMNG